jgi:diadenosine tetraphosphate (Ap4A) HIT family hydrolase
MEARAIGASEGIAWRSGGFVLRLRGGLVKGGGLVSSGMSNCLACQRIAKIRSGENPFFIAELSESFVVLHDHQPYEGWCVLLLKDHHEHLHLLPVATQARLAEDMARVAAAIAEVCSPRRINYECLGNQLAHIHWHVIPRYESPRDPDPTSAIWARPAAELQGGMDPKKREETIFRLRRAGLRREA